MTRSAVGFPSLLLPLIVNRMIFVSLILLMHYGNSIWIADSAISIRTQKALSHPLNSFLYLRLVQGVEKFLIEFLLLILASKVSNSLFYIILNTLIVDRVLSWCILFVFFHYENKIQYILTCLWIN